MKSTTHYQLMKLDVHGREFPVLESPGKALEPFKKKTDAVDWALEHPDQFPSGRYLAKSIEVLSETAESTPAEASTEGATA